MFQAVPSAAVDVANEAAKVAAAEGEAGGEGVAGRAGAILGVDGWKTITAQLRDMWSGLLHLLPNLVIALVVIVVTALLARLAWRIARSLSKRARLRGSLRSLVGQLVYIAIWVMGLLIATTIIFPSVKPGGLIAGLGISSIAIGFAFKDIAENFVAGVLILWKFPVEIGDYIEVDGIEGTIEEITIRMTLLRQVDGDLIAVPNATLFKNPVANLTNWPDKRVTVMCGVAYGEDVGEARKVIARAVEGCKTVRRGGEGRGGNARSADNRPIQIFAKEFGDSSINFEVTWWTGSRPVEVRQSRDEVVEAVKRGLDDAGIEIPFPYRTLTFKEPLPVLRADGEVGDGRVT